MAVVVLALIINASFSHTIGGATSNVIPDADTAVAGSEMVTVTGVAEQVGSEVLRTETVWSPASSPLRVNGKEPETQAPPSTWNSKPLPEE